jgi:hypothetical protein
MLIFRKEGSNKVSENCITPKNVQLGYLNSTAISVTDKLFLLNKIYVEFSEGSFGFSTGFLSFR